MSFDPPDAPHSSLERIADGIDTLCEHLATLNIVLANLIKIEAHKPGVPLRVTETVRDSMIALFSDEELLKDEPTTDTDEEEP